jgi:hypothetical protein
MVTEYPTMIVGVPGPRETMFTLDDKARLESISDFALLPVGGAAGNVLIKDSATNYDVRWANAQSFNGTLSALGQPAGYAPISDGLDGWDWAEVADPVVEWGDIDDKPTFGTASESDVEDFAAAVHTHDADAVVSGELDPDRVPVVLDLNGITRGTAAPAGGVDGDIYLQYTP